jgi:hypothetical protein
VEFHFSRERGGNSKVLRGYGQSVSDLNGVDSEGCSGMFSALLVGSDFDEW